MEFRKNDILTLDIEDCGVDGEGIGKADGFTVFVKDAVIGDRIKAKIIKAKKNYGYGRLMEVITKRFVDSWKESEVFRILIWNRSWGWKTPIIIETRHSFR